MNSPSAPPEPSIGRPKWPHHLFAYTLSLPERAIRELVGVVGGVAYLATFAVPKQIRKSKFFRLAVQRQIKMMTDDVGQAKLFPSAAALDQKTAVRMGVGGAVDNLLLLSLHASPLWLLFAATDVCRGAQAFVRDIGMELKAAGVMSEGSRLDSVEDVLAGLASLSDRASDSLDMPPITLADMKSTVRAIRSEFANVADTALNTANLEGLAKDVAELARGSQRSLLETSAAVATGAMRTTGNLLVGTAVGTTATIRFVGKTALDAFDDYADSIKELRNLGFQGAITSFLKPHGHAQRRLFHYRFLSVTERGLSFGRWSKAPWRLQ